MRALHVWVHEGVAFRGQVRVGLIVTSIYVCQRLLRAFVDGSCFLRVLQRE